MSLKLTEFWMQSKRMGEKLKMTVWTRNIHLPLVEVGLNLQIPLEISWTIDWLGPTLVPTKKVNFNFELFWKISFSEKVIWNYLLWKTLFEKKLQLIFLDLLLHLRRYFWACLQRGCYSGCYFGYKLGCSSYLRHRPRLSSRGPSCQLGETVWTDSKSKIHPCQMRLQM